MSAPRKPGSEGPGPALPGSLAVRPGYEVGYAKPPEDTKFRKGVSGNPRGRPKGAKNNLPALSEERMKAIILEEAYRTITVRDGTKNVTVPIARAVLRSLAVNAVKGQHRSQRLFSELLASVETSNRASHDEWIQTAINYKVEWDRELARRKRFGITDAPAPLPHPDHVLIDFRAGTARIVGPATREEQAEWEKWIERRGIFEAELEECQQMLEDATDENEITFMKAEIAQTEKVLRIIRSALGEAK
jgi:Family of unknown function (DUF5681)